MDILIMLSRPPFVFCKRCSCCNALVSGHTLCLSCTSPVYFCDSNCQKKAQSVHSATCEHVSQQEKRAKVTTSSNEGPFPPLLNKQDDSYAAIIDMRHPNESQFIVNLANEELGAALKTQ